MRKSFVIHPLLFAVFPVLYLFAQNVDKLPLDVILVPIAVTTCFALLSWFLLGLVLKDNKKAGLLVSLFLFLFFSYGYFHEAIKNLYISTGGFFVGLTTDEFRVSYNTSKVLIPMWGVLFLFGTYFSVKTRRNLNDFTNLLNVVAASLIIISIIRIGDYKLKTFAQQDDISLESIVEIDPIELQKATTLPNIYYVILDGYARADILKEIYQYDNSEFLDYLTEKEFYIASKSRSNYSHTRLSLTSSLNFMYINDLVKQPGFRFEPVIKDNRFFHFLKQQGYKIVAFSSWYSYTDIKNADIYITPKQWVFDEFQTVLINSTLVPYLITTYDYYGPYRRHLLYPLDHLVDTVEMDGPIFVFAHVMAAHAPFVFGPYGEAVLPKISHKDAPSYKDEYVKGYTNQLQFVNSKIEMVIDGLLSKSTRPTIIILQADHGPDSRADRFQENPDNSFFYERFAIFNAYYLPNNGHIRLYEEITPVNTFRLISNHYFGINFEMLKDENYYSHLYDQFEFLNITEFIDVDEKITKSKHLTLNELEGKVYLLGYEVSQQTISPGETLPLTLYWQIPEDKLDYSQFFKVFVHLRDPLTGETLLRADHWPSEELFSPTSQQPGGEIISLESSTLLQLPPELPSGYYDLWVGIYNPDTLERLTVARDTSGENALYLGELVVQR